MTTPWVPGQRVLSRSEPELGIGIVLESTESSVVDVYFEDSRLRRRYAARNAPLRRLLLEVGQSAQPKKGSAFKIERVQDRGGLRIYEGEGQSLSEEELSSQVQDLGVLDQFLIGQWTPPQAFDLREQAWQLVSRSLRSRLRGLSGPRVSLLPHQLYIAHEVSRRERPRALLADEVGLGKTIEAGLIYSSLRALGRANRVLVLTPESLKHQWLAELYRRFNILFSVVSEDSEGLSEFQNAIVSIDFLLAAPKNLEEALMETWDLVIVDEAHHLVWKESHGGENPSEAWQAVRKISEISTGLLLLTATPRQQGLETQFGLLNLVDPDRFSDFKNFCKEAAQMKDVSSWAQQLEEKTEKRKVFEGLRERFPKDSELQDLLNANADPAQDSKSTDRKLIEALTDRHGTGRVLFRNRRERLRGFPERKLYGIPLSQTQDSRKKWLLEYLQSLNGEKSLILCSHLSQVKELDRFLQKESGIKKAIFHEELELVDRDRQAAWFAENRGAQILISSEVGGEGRNFQFCHKLVLYDLPSHPDLVEQRIGRLDRIGQGKTIEIFVPWCENTRDEVYFRWFHEGLNCFRQSWNGLATLEEKFRHEIESCVQSIENGEGKKKIDLLIAGTQKAVAEYKSEQQASVDYLLDLNSFRPEIGQSLVEYLNHVESDSLLKNYMTSCWDYFGVEQEDFDRHASVKLSPGSLMFVQNFPELEDEKVVTFSRSVALSREDFTFLTQDHPMVQGSLTLLLNQNQGMASACLSRGEKAGNYFEFLFVFQVVAPPLLEVERFLPPETLRITVDHLGNFVPRLNLARGPLKPLPEPMMRTSLAQLALHLPKIFEKAQAEILKSLPQKISSALEKASEALGNEESRLKSLRAVNKSVTELEIVTLCQKKNAVMEAILQAQLRLDALRMVLVS